jgi:Na+/H+-translocating membrane pyrophosphatase
MGILACIASSIFGIYYYKIDYSKKVSLSLNIQLVLSTFLTLITLYFSSYILPETWTDRDVTYYRSYAFLAVSFGLVSGFLIGIITDYYTSHEYTPVRRLSRACISGPAINVIYGLSLGYMSTVIPVIIIAITILVSMSLLGLLGIALAAIGMLSTLSIGLAIDGFGPISDNAGGIAEMAELGENIRARTDVLDSAGNTTAAIGKGFAIGSATLVALALFGAFIERG